MRLLLCCLLAMLWSGANSIAQNRTANIRPLTVGDTLPPDLILENVTNYPVSKIRMSDLKGKLIILDFWGKHCAPCILALAKLDSLQQASHGKIQVITISDFENKDELYKTLRRFKQTQNLSLPVILGNGQLIKYFPYRLVSHLVWIDGNGMVKAITGSEYITRANIENILTGKPVNWLIKKDVLDFDANTPLLEYTQSQLSRPKSIFYSAFTSYMPGISPANGTRLDSSRGVYVTSFYNFSLLQFSSIALEYKNNLDTSNFIFNVYNISRYREPVDSFNPDWKKSNTYCYFLESPISLSTNERRDFIQSDIKRWLGTLGVMVEKREVHYPGKKSKRYSITERNSLH